MKTIPPTIFSIRYYISKIRAKQTTMTPPTLTPLPYPENKPDKYGTYLVMRKDGKVHTEVYNNTGWAYNDKVIVFYYTTPFADISTSLVNTK